MASLQDISALISSRELAEASAALQKLVRKKGKRPVDWYAAMRMAASLGDQDLALEAAKNWLNEAPHEAVRIAAVIEALGAVAKHKEAAQLARQLRDKPGAAADGYYLEGAYAARFGERERALSLFRRALGVNPQHTAAWEQIALLNGYENFQADLEQMLTLSSQIRAAELLIPLSYALGRAFDHVDNFDKAFHCFSTGAALRDRLYPYDLKPRLAYYQRLAATFTPELLRRLASESGGEGHVFILGAPRSGSTLYEQIIATAPGVTPTGEHLLMRMASLPLGSMEPPDMARAEGFKKSDWRKMAQVYLTGVRRRFGPGKIYTDKSMLNYNYAGLIGILFPQARLIWCSRDLRDVAWSCFRSRISANQWTQKLETCAEFLLAQQKLSRHWSSVFGDNFLELPYERLITAPGAASASLFAHAGLSRPEDWKDFYRNKGSVATASLAQVRQPLNDKSIGAWRRYEKHLAPIYDKYFQ